MRAYIMGSDGSLDNMKTIWNNHQTFGHKNTETCMNLIRYKGGKHGIGAPKSKSYFLFHYHWVTARSRRRVRNQVFIGSARPFI